jgi:hypothetical protein
MWIQKLAIRVFRLQDIKNLLLNSKQKQKDLDEKYWKEILQEKIDRLNRDHQLELQEKDAQISMLNQHIDSYKQREKEVDQKEFSARQQIKQNYSVALNIVSEMKDFNDSVNRMYGKMLGIQDTVVKHKSRIEEK